MNFKTNISFNNVDCTFARVGGRLVIELGVFKRCQAIVRLMRDRNLRGISDMRAALDNRYPYKDLYVAARKLRKAGVLRHDGYGRWVMVLRGEQLWNENCPARYRVRILARNARAA